MGISESLLLSRHLILQNLVDQGTVTSVFSDPVTPVDYEKFINENMDMLKSESLLLFPDDDVSTSTVQRKYRTVEIPLPGQARCVGVCGA